MMELLRQWLLGVTGAAMVVTLADCMTPQGTVKKVAHLLGGLVLLVAVIKPVTEVDFAAMAAAQIRLELPEDYQTVAEETDVELMKVIIAENTGAYILDKAQMLGIPCQSIMVTCAATEQGVPYPTAVVVYGEMDAQQRQQLVRCIASDLAIPEERQTFVSGGGGAT